MDIKKRIMVVDDEEGIRDVLSMMLSTQFEVVTAENGVEAISLLDKDQRPIDLIISDVRMPRMDGVNLLDEIKKRSPFTPTVVLLTGFADIDQQEAYHRGAAAFLKKPLSKKDLFEVVERMTLTFPRYHEKGEQKEVTLEVSLRFSSLENALASKIFNVGQGGIFIANQDSAQVGSFIRFNISFGSVGCKDLQGIGKVMWKRGVIGALPSGIGVQFVELPQDVEECLSKFMAQRGMKSYIPKE